MDRNMRTLGERFSFCVEKSAGEIFPLFDVRGERGASQNSSHFFRNGNKNILEELQLNGIELYHQITFPFLL